MLVAQPLIVCLVVLALLLIVLIGWLCALRRLNKLGNEFEQMRQETDEELMRLQANQPGEALTKTDVVMLIHEEFERLAPATVLATAAKEAITSEAERDESEVFYFAAPTAERMFDHELHTLCPVEDTLYRLTPMRDEPNRAVVDLCATPRALVGAIEDFSRLLAPVCAFEVAPTLTSEFRQASAGVAVRKNGFWTLIRKIEIET